MGGRVVASILAVVLASAVPLVLVPERAESVGTLQAYLTGLNWPVAIALAPDGRIFFAERFTGNIRIVQGGALLSTPFFTLTNTATAGEQGLLGLALDPGFPANPFVYAYHTYRDPGSGMVYNRIVRLRANGNAGTFDSVLLAPITAASIHNGGVIGFGPDGKLYAVVGDASVMANAQNLMVRNGKVLRMNPDGTVPADNPFAGSLSVDNYIYTFGHRNMFGLTFHPITKSPYVTENGPACNDEVNLLIAGRNYGWGPMQTCNTPPPPPQNTNQDGPTPRQLPLVFYTPTIAPTNAAIYTGTNFTAFRNDLIMGDWNTGSLRHLVLAPPNYDAVTSQAVILTVPQGILDVESGPDGAIWFTTQSTIYRYYESDRPPVASFTATPGYANPGAPVTFDGTGSFDPDGTIVSHTWDFGDGAMANGAVVTHAYAAPGVYSVKLTVVDNYGLFDEATGQVLINATPSAAFSASRSRANPGVPVTFDASASTDDGTIVSYLWEFGDGATDGGLVVVHGYASPGAYEVTLTVTDDLSLADNATMAVTINAPPLASFTATPPRANPGAPVTFDATTSADLDGTIASYAWDFGDGATAFGVTAMHAYGAPGVYTVTLTVEDNEALSDDAIAQVVINTAPLASFTATPVRANPDSPITFDASPSTDDGVIVSYSWDFGDGATGTGAIVTHAYLASGVYTVTLTVLDDDTLSDTATRQVAINAAPLASFDATPTPANPGDPVTFDASSSVDDGTIVSYAWDFGDGATGSGVLVIHAYGSPGTFDVTLTVADDLGLSDTEVLVVRINAHPHASFTAAPQQTFLEVSIMFDATASTDDGVIVSYVWDFGDGLAATGVTVSHAYGAKGLFTVTLTAVDEMGLAGRSAGAIFIGNRAPAITKAVPEDATLRVVAGGVVTLSVTATDPDHDSLTYTWRVDGSVRGGSTPSLDVRETAAGTYAINVTVSDGTLSAWRQWTATVFTPSPVPASPVIAWTTGALVAAAILVAVLVAWRRRKRRRT